MPPQAPLSVRSIAAYNVCLYLVYVGTWIAYRTYVHRLDVEWTWNQVVYDGKNISTEKIMAMGNSTDALSSAFGCTYDHRDAFDGMQWASGTYCS